MSYGASLAQDDAADGRTGVRKVVVPLGPTMPSAKRTATGFSLSLPRPPSVNRFTYGKDGRPLGNKSKFVQAWQKECDGLLMMTRPRPPCITGAFELWVTWTGLSWDDIRGGSFDADNPVKPLLDWLQRVELIWNDRFMHDLHVTWGLAPHGCIVRAAPWVPA